MSYRILFRSAHPLFLPLGLLARLPGAIAPMGTLMLVSDATGSVAFAGFAAGLQTVAGAAGGIGVGRLVERLGPRRIGLIGAALNGAMTAGLVMACHLGRAETLVAAVAAGLCQPQVGALARGHWSALAQVRRDRDLLTTALAWEAAADEASFVVGPALVGLLAAVSPDAPLIAAVLLVWTAACPFARFYVRPTPIPGQPQAPPKLPVRRLAPLLAAMACVGAIFGVLQIAVTAYAHQTHTAAGAGLLYAGLGAGSAAAGLAYARLPRRFPLLSRYLAFSATLLFAALLLGLPGTVLPLPAAMVIGGTGIAPYMISVYALAEATAPRRVATVMSLLTAAGPAGTAAGQTLAGTIAQNGGSHTTFLLVPAIGAIALTIAGAVYLVEHRRQPHPKPHTPH